MEDPKELNTMDMKVPVFMYSNVYLNVPSGKTPLYNRELIALVSYLGKEHGRGKNNNLSKGITFIYDSLKENSSYSKCITKRQIKMMLRNVPRAILSKDGVPSYIYRCSRNCFVEIFRIIINESDIKRHIKSDNSNNNNNCAQIFLSKQLDGLCYLSQNGNSKDIKKEAEEMRKGLESV